MNLLTSFNEEKRRDGHQTDSKSTANAGLNEIEAPNFMFNDDEEERSYSTAIMNTYRTRASGPTSPV